MNDEQQNKRRVLIATVAVVGLIGLVGVTVALVSDGGDGIPTGTSTPGASIDPLSVEGQCRADGVLRFVVAPDPKAAAEYTATGAVEPWVGQGELSQTTNTGDDTKLVSISKPGELPREVLTVERKDGAWSITQTAACLAADEKGVACNPRLTLKKSTFTRERISASTSAAETFIGNGSLAFPESATLEQCVRPLAPRGEVGPVSAYGAGTTEATVVTDRAGEAFFG